MREPFKSKFAQYMGTSNLQIGSGHNLETDPGWINLDMNPNSGAQVIHNLHDLPLPFADEQFDCVMASHTLEHIDRDKLIDLFYEIARILKPKGHLLAFVPYGASFAAWENPHHRQCFTEMTWIYFDRRLYDQKGTAGEDAGQLHKYAIWQTIELSFAPTKEWQLASPEQLDQAMKMYNNVIDEMQVVLRKESM